MAMNSIQLYAPTSMKAFSFENISPDEASDTDEADDDADDMWNQIAHR